MKIPTTTNKTKKQKKSKTLQEQGRKTITTFYAFSVKLSDEREKRRKNKKYKEVFKVA